MNTRPRPNLDHLRSHTRQSSAPSKPFEKRRVYMLIPLADGSEGSKLYVASCRDCSDCAAGL
jgi:hypothetical protein